MPINEPPVFLHAAHQVRQAFDGLQLISWLAIGIGVGALVLSWGRLLAWIREPEHRPPTVKRWGEDAAGWYFELERAGADQWSIQSDAHESVPLVTDSDHVPILRPERPLQGRPTHIVSALGLRLSL